MVPEGPARCSLPLFCGDHCFDTLAEGDVGSAVAKPFGEIVAVGERDLLFCRWGPLHAPLSES